MVVATVISESDDNTFYRITALNGTRRFRCTCPHNVYRRKTCKHIKKYKDLLKGKKVDGVFLVSAA